MAFSNPRRKYPKGTHRRSIDDRSGRDVWIIDSDTDNENPADAENASGIPSLGQSYPGDFFLQVADKDTVQINKRTFEVTVIYAAKQDGEDSEEDDPLNQPAQITYSTVYRQEQADSDIHGEAIDNTAREPFDPPITIDVAGIVMSVTRNVAEFTIAGLAQYMNTINSDAFMGLPPGTCRVVGIRSTKVTTRTPFYFRATVDIEIRMTENALGNVVGWKRLIMNQGFKRLDDNGDQKEIKVKDDQGRWVRPREPKLLNFGGQVLEKNLLPHFEEFDIYKSVPFAGMNLGV